MSKLGRPILKWAGGKSSLTPRILEKLPQHCDIYYEPFAGGAAVFFALASERRFERRARFEHAVLADTNDELMNTYRVVQGDVEELIALLAQFKYDERVYYAMREWEPETDVERAARMIYLNKTCFNGLYRVNRSGKFNVPFGSFKKPPLICDQENLRAANELLQGCQLKTQSFQTTGRSAMAGDAVYFDPPYLPLSKTSNFTSYQKLAFGLEQHRALRDKFVDLHAQGVTVVLSNSDCPAARELFEGVVGAHVESIEARRAINSRKEGRGPIGELLVSNALP